MKSFPILELSEEVQALIVDRVAANSSLIDFFNLGVTCQSMKALTEQRMVYRFFDVLSIPWSIRVPPYFFQMFYDEGNPSTLFMKGVQYFYTWNLREEGLALLKAAADAGYERAVYVYAMTQKIFWDDEEYFARLTRESVVRVGKLVRGLKWGWGMWHGEDYILKRDLFIINVVPTIYSCPCVPVLDRDWELVFIENSKGDNMCDRCFWIKEVGLFLREFEPMNVFRDTRKW